MRIAQYLWRVAGDTRMHVSRAGREGSGGWNDCLERPEFFAAVWLHSPKAVML